MARTQKYTATHIYKYMYICICVCTLLCTYIYIYLYISCVIYTLYRWLSARLQYLQCVSNGDTALSHWYVHVNPYSWWSKCQSPVKKLRLMMTRDNWANEKNESFRSSQSGFLVRKMTHCNRHVFWLCEYWIYIFLDYLLHVCSD